MSEISLETIQLLLKNADWRIRVAAMKQCVNRDVPLEIIQQGLKDNDYCVRLTAIEACHGKNIPLEIFWKGLNDEDAEVRVAAMEACQGIDIPLKTIQKWFDSDNWQVRVAAMRACEEKEVSLKTIQKGLMDRSPEVRSAAILVCEKKEISLNDIQQLLKDKDAWKVREIIRKICKVRGIEIPLYRSIEPPAKVYKKCLGDVVVVATIPDDAEIRGRFNGKCRTNKAKIVDIIGDISGEKIGISVWDKKTIYRIGDKIEITDFDKSDEECSTGFHFFCTKEQAVNQKIL